MIVVGEERLKIVKLVVEWFEEIKALSFGERLIAKLSERYQEFNVLVRQKYGIMPGSSGGMNNYNNTNTTNAMGGYMLMNGANPSLFFQQKQMMCAYAYYYQKDLYALVYARPSHFLSSHKHLLLLL